MIEKTNKEETSLEVESYKKLSIQVSLNGLSFFVLDTITNEVVLFDRVLFKTSSTPYLAQKELKQLFKKHKLVSLGFSEVTVVHKNEMFALVPKALFEAEELANYLKFNTKLLANDHIEYDELTNLDIVCVYVPFTNINNFVFEQLGEFEFRHNSIAFLQTILKQKIGSKQVCFVHKTDHSFELAVFEQKKLVLYNQFEYKTKEDFLYYILFTYEQLKLDVESVKLKLFGQIEEGDTYYDICYQYIKKVNVFEPMYDNISALNIVEDKSIDLTLLNSL
ncbi:DUF3822 family protein [uncultured Croceitalea sp.]|uniref:DUF3822 family protein n=1 Tax=uncultured Croceitalea sp. TaxID=1798908 RepID=UPI003305B0CE